MSLNLFKRKEKGTHLNDEITLKDNFQFNLSDVTTPVSIDRIIEVTNEKFKKNNWLNFNETKPSASLWYVELLMDAIFNSGNFGEIKNLIFNEVGFPEVSRKSKKNKKDGPKLDILDSYPINFEMTSDYVHLPQVIANFFMNLNNDQVNYAGRKEYIENILSFYDEKYGQLFKKRFGLLPSQSVQLPSEDHWTSKYGYEKPVEVKGLIKETEAEPVPVPEHLSETKAFVTKDEDPAKTHNQFNPLSETNYVPTIPNEVHKPTTIQTIQTHPTKQTSFYLDPMFQQLDNLRTAANVQPEKLLVKNLAPVSDKEDNFVLAQVDGKRKEFNEIRTTAADSLNSSAEQKLGAKIDAFKQKLSNFSDDFDTTNNVEVKAHDIVDPQINLEKKNAEDVKIQEIRNSETQKIEQENARHQNELDNIATNANDQIDLARSSNETHYELLRNKKVSENIEKIKAELEKQKTEELTKITDDFVSQLQTLSAEISQSSNAYMNQLLSKQNQELERFENLQLKIHAEAEKRKLALDKLEISNSRADNLSNLLKGKNEELAEKNASIDDLREELASLKATNRTLESSNLTSDRVNQFLASKEKDFTLKDYLELQILDQEENSKTKNEGLKVALVSLIILIILVVFGTTGFVLYSANQKLQSQNQIALQRAKTASDKQAQLEAKRKKESQQKKSQKQFESKATQLQKLDTALDNGDLSIYQQDFKDNQLGNNPDRVLKVGQLLVKNGQRDDAIKLAKDNPEANSKLNQYLGI